MNIPRLLKAVRASGLCEYPEGIVIVESETRSGMWNAAVLRRSDAPDISVLGSGKTPLEAFDDLERAVVQILRAEADRRSKKENDAAGVLADFEKENP